MVCKGHDCLSYKQWRERERERERREIMGAYNDDQANNFTSIFPEIYMLHVNMIQYRIY